MKSKEPKSETFDQWAVVELFGHQRIVGRVTEAQIGGGSFLRVDVVDDKDKIVLTKFYGAAAIYGITPVSKRTAIAVARNCASAPVTEWDVKPLLDQVTSRRRELEENHD